VFIDDLEITALENVSLRHARRKMGMIFQSFNLLANRTVFRNISFPLELESWSGKDIRDRVREISELVGIEGKLESYPSQLSGGEKQRVGIARALANGPDVLLSDEATSALDPRTTASVLKLLRNINEALGLTVVLITHEMNVIKEICDNVAVLDSGRIAESGEVLEIFLRPRRQITKELLTNVARSRFPESLADLKFTLERENSKSDVLVELSFLGDTAARPIIADLVRNFDVDVNILAAHVEHIKTMPYGTLIIQLSGDEREAALERLLDINLRVEVIGFVERSGPAAL
jgi:D-methionine transport system ATP-binding protein